MKQNSLTKKQAYRALRRRVYRRERGITIILFLISLIFILPTLLVVAVSFTEEESLRKYGFHLVPKVFSTEAYKMVFERPISVLRAYGVTIFGTFVGATLSLAIMSLLAYAIGSKRFSHRKGVTFFVFFTMLFSGGLIPSYIINTRLFGLANTLTVHVVLGLVPAYYVLILRTFFRQIPDSLIESAHIDGASEIKIFLYIILPLSKPALATIYLFQILGRWNDWQTSLYYISKSELIALQYMLQRVLRQAEFIRDMMASGRFIPTMDLAKSMPTESLRFALCVVAAGPMVAIFPFFQKHFTKGITLGSIKG